MPHVGMQFSIQPSQPLKNITYNLTINGQTVPAKLTASGVSYQPSSPLAPGTYSVSLSIDQSFHQSWSFTIQKNSVTLQPPNHQQLAALQLVNEYRAYAHLPLMQLSKALDASSQAHSNFYVQNQNLYGNITLAVHQETSSWPGFTGKTVVNRAEFFGFPSAAVGEVMNFGRSENQAISDWMSTVYHRLILLNPWTTSMGYGQAGNPSQSLLPVTTIDVGAKTPPSSSLSYVAYPVPGQMQVPLQFTGGEIPDPLANTPYDNHYPVGYPITFGTFDPSVTSLSATSATLTTSGHTVPSYLLAPNQGTGEQYTELGNALAVIPLSPLSPNTTYTVAVSGQVTLQNGVVQPFQKTWSFSTSPIPLNLVQAPQLHVLLNGKPLNLNTIPLVVNERTMLPFRSLLTALGATVHWNPAYPDFATATSGSHTLQIQFNNQHALLDSKNITFSTPPVVFHNRSYVPLRFIANSLGLSVHYDQTTYTITLTSPSHGAF